jgi:hypothetical protein
MRVRNATRRDFLLSVAASIPAIPALAADSPRDKGRRLADKVIGGLGGDGFRNMYTRTEIGRAYSFYRDKISGFSLARIYTRYGAARSDNAGEGGGLRQMQRQVFGKKQEDAVLFTASEAFDVTYRGAKPLADERVKQFRESTLHDVFYILRERYTEPDVEFEDAGADIIENQAVQILDVFDAENRQLRVWVSSISFLPVKQRFRRWDPIINDWREEVTRYTKYRDVGHGVMWPYSTERERDTEKIYEMYSEHVTIDDALPESMFELPNGIKILKK